MEPRHVKIRSADDSDETRLTAFAKEAASLDAVRGDPTRTRPPVSSSIAAGSPARRRRVVGASGHEWAARAPPVTAPEVGSPSSPRPTLHGSHRNDTPCRPVLFPAGSYGDRKTIRIRATIADFDRDAYRIGPKYTEGWLARVQSLAKVVAENGTVELSLFARAE